MIKMSSINREFTQRRRQQLRKRYLKSEFVLPQTLPRLFHPVNSSNVGKFFWSWLILKDCIKVLEMKKKVVAFCSRPRQNVKLGSFTL